VPRFSRSLLGIIAGLPTPIAASLLLLGSVLLFVPGAVGTPPYLSSASAAVLSPESAVANGSAPSRESVMRALAPARVQLEAQSAALLARWAPNFARDVSPDHPERDRPLPIDFDGDWDATNNWAHLTPAFAHMHGTIYGSAILTPTHAYLTYTLFYPRDWFSPVCVSYICHDNDLEVLLLVVSRAAQAADDELLFVETKAHNAYVALRESELRTDGEGRPWIAVESQGHGMYPIRTNEPLPNGARRFIAGPVASVQPEFQPSTERYDLASLHDLLWARRSPQASQSALWASGETGFLAYIGGRQGRRGFSLGASMAGRKYAGGVRPPWGLKASSGERGDWFLDPAYVALMQHRDWLAHPTPSLQYVFNPFLDDLSRECSAGACPAIPPLSSPGRGRVGVAGGALLAIGLASLSARRRGYARWPRFSRRWRGP
jgi:hypothetical protein